MATKSAKRIIKPTYRASLMLRYFRDNRAALAFYLHVRAYPARRQGVMILHRGTFQ